MLNIKYFGECRGIKDRGRFIDYVWRDLMALWMVFFMLCQLTTIKIILIIIVFLPFLVVFRKLLNQ